MSRQFISERIEPLGILDAGATLRGEPALPSAFRWRDRELHVQRVEATRRGTKTDRGDVYLKRHYYEFVTPQGERAMVYFDRDAKSWWIYTLSTPEEAF